ncbi:hypothetical protein [Lacrimispora amygdalina]|uniref:hypothetical protein n=1 Tax=Lacrimispora amygdalina TaxID=253257 RepID=UPI000BE2407C|nr:hypothetical protein [Lacrimispora amygdalina]
MLNKITFTGIDNETKVEELINLKKNYPFAEFGLLISESNTNKDIVNRYPSLNILERLDGAGLDLSLHICGKWARDIIKNNEWNLVYKLIGPYIALFNRIQLNIAGVIKFSDEILFPVDKQILIQFTTDKTHIYEKYKNPPKICGFQDASGGRGIPGTDWVSTMDLYFGYAGGINEDNVLDVIEAIDKVNKNDFWIDMESSIRKNDNFDISKCRNICAKCEKNIKS